MFLELLRNQKNGKQRQFDPEQMKLKLQEIFAFLRENNLETQRSLEIFGLDYPGQKSTDSLDQFIGNLRKWYEGHDPYADQRMTRSEELERFILGSISGNPFREGDLEVFNRYTNEQRGTMAQVSGEIPFGC